MKTFIIAMSVFGVVFTVSTSLAQEDNIPQYGEQQYINGIEDLPLYSDCQPFENQQVIYDVPEGRFIEASYFCPEQAYHAIKKYYQLALPQLGWEEKNNKYYRDEEVLMMEINRVLHNLVVKFTLKPQVTK